jgi:hypothetical protein
MNPIPFLFAIALLSLAAACTPSEPEPVNPGERPGASTIAASADPAKPETYTGHSLDEASRFAAQHGVTWRVVERDGEALMATMDYRPDRLNFSVRDGTVIKTTKG